MPIAPAIRPARSCSDPSVAEIVRASDWVKVSGRAPNFSELARLVAPSWVNPPSIWVVPEMRALMLGAVRIRWSSTNATCLPMLAPV